MNKDDLTKLGITDEDLIQKIIVLHGKDIENHKNSLSTMKAELDGVKSQLKEAGDTIDGFKKLDVEGIKKAADDWKAKAEQAEKDAQSQVSALKFDYALNSALVEAKAKNVKAVKALLNTEQLKLGDDGSLVGLNDQLTKIKTENDFLFVPEKQEKPQPKFSSGGNQEPIIGDKVVEAARKAAGLQTGENNKS